MGRKPRLVLDGGYYHITQRGNDRRKVFRDTGDYTKFCSLLKKYLAKYVSSLYHYCLMPNHVHLLLRTVQAGDLARLMQGINLSYTLYYKRAYRFTGSLWQGRYNSIVIEKDSYLMECGRYIERNPIRAGLVQDPKDYLYSGYNFHAYGKPSDIITEDILYQEMGQDAAQRQQRYRAYVLEERAYDTIIDKVLKL